MYGSSKEKTVAFIKRVRDESVAFSEENQPDVPLPQLMNDIMTATLPPVGARN
jgi:hypothetical protein